MTLFDPLKSQTEIDFKREGRAFLIALAIIAGASLAGVAGVWLLIWGMM